MADGHHFFLLLTAIVQRSTVFVYTYLFYSQVRNRQHRHFNRFNFLFFCRTVVCPGYHPGTDDVYNMTARPRGITLIIDNASFAHHPKHGQQSPRHGSKEDVRQVEALFTALDFSVRTKENLSRLQLLDELYYIAREDHSAYDCFVLWLMSHGRSGEVFCSDGDTIPIQTLHDMFSNCDTLSGKPKLFFIQACRGEGEDEGVSVAANTTISSYELLGPNQVDSPIGAVKKPASKVPTHADFLYTFSTVDKYVSYRHEALGSFYVRGLVEAFRERAVYDHLLDILTVVNQKVSNMEANIPSVGNKNEIKVFKQMPEVKHTLRKKVRF